MHSARIGSVGPDAKLSFTVHVRYTMIAKSLNHIWRGELMVLSVVKSAREQVFFHTALFAAALFMQYTSEEKMST